MSPRLGRIVYKVSLDIDLSGPLSITVFNRSISTS